MAAVLTFYRSSDRYHVRAWAEGYLIEDRQDSNRVICRFHGCEHLGRAHKVARDLNADDVTGATRSFLASIADLPTEPAA